MPAHGSVIFHHVRDSRVPDVDTFSIWCGGCARYLDGEYPSVMPAALLAEHEDRVHGVLPLGAVTERAAFRGPEWADVGGIGA